MLNQGYVQLPEFTFQYVSINTVTRLQTMITPPNLHSNMFLLIPKNLSVFLLEFHIYIPICFY